jgi:hypothetical protein
LSRTTTASQLKPLADFFCGGRSMAKKKAKKATKKAATKKAAPKKKK